MTTLYEIWKGTSLADWAEKIDKQFATIEEQIKTIKNDLKDVGELDISTETGVQN